MGYNIAPASFSVNIAIASTCPNVPLIYFINNAANEKEHTLEAIILLTPHEFLPPHAGIICCSQRLPASPRSGRISARRLFSKIF